MENVLQRQLRESKLKTADIIVALTALGGFDEWGRPFNRRTLWSWSNGIKPIPDDIQILLQQVLNTLPKDHLKAAANATTIHSVFKNLRLALPLSYEGMATALQPHLPLGNAPSTTVIVFWEKEADEPHSALPNDSIFAGTDPITAYGKVFKDHGLGEWFEANKNHFSQLLDRASEARRRDILIRKLVANGTNVSRITDRPESWGHGI